MQDPSADLHLPDAVERVAASVVGLVTRRHRSSGVLWRDGVIAGSAAALWRAGTVSVVLPGGETVEGELRGIDGGTDLAAIACAGARLPVAERAAAAEPRVGEFVFAAGRSAAGVLHASFGHVGAAGGAWRSWRGGDIDRLVRLDGGLYPGLDGGPVADREGRVLGVASSSLSRHHGVAVPVATVDRVLDALLAHGRVPQGYLGIAAQPVRTTLDGASLDGLLVSSVAPDGPGARGGLRVGDVITRIDDRPVANLDALRGALKVAAQAQVHVIRGDQALALTLTVAERPVSRCG
jgi:S1-C subfamily serine protease